MRAPRPASAASTYSNPKRLNRCRCVPPLSCPPYGPPPDAATVARSPFRPEPISLTTSSGPIALLRRPFHDPAHLPVQVFLRVRRRNPGVHHATPIILGRHYDVVAPVGQLLDLQVPAAACQHEMQAGGGRLVEAVEGVPKAVRLMRRLTTSIINYSILYMSNNC